VSGGSYWGASVQGDDGFACGLEESNLIFGFNDRNLKNHKLHQFAVSGLILHDVAYIQFPQAVKHRAKSIVSMPCNDGIANIAYLRCLRHTTGSNPQGCVFYVVGNG
jgi:hypothetical protein